MKRKVASLSPLSKELFEERQRLCITIRGSVTFSEEGQRGEETDEAVCRKSFGSKNSFDQHERSKRHLQGLKKMQEEFQNAPAPESPAGAEAVVEEVEEKEKVTMGYTEPFTPEEYSFEPCRCLFCRKDSDSFDA